MRLEKSNFTTYPPQDKIEAGSRAANISNLLKNVKQEAKREKITKIYTIVVVVFLVLFFATIIYKI